MRERYKRESEREREREGEREKYRERKREKEIEREREGERRVCERELEMWRVKLGRWSFRVIRTRRKHMSPGEIITWSSAAMALSVISM